MADCGADFGEPGAWFGLPGQSVSYPWQTPDENLHKHEGYTWVVRCDIPNPNNDPAWITDFRVQGHVDTMPFLMPTGQWMGGYLGNQHSVSVEVAGCTAAGCGTMKFGQWSNYGRLEIDEGNCVLLPGDPEGFPCGSGPGGRRLHFECLQPAQERCTFFWYGEPDATLGSEGAEALSPVIIAFASADATVGTRLDTLFMPDLAMLCPDMQCQFNGSTISMHILQFNVHASFDPDGDGFVTGAWFLTRYGRVVNECMSVDVDCIPIIFDHMPAGDYKFLDGINFGYGPEGAVDFDTSPAALGTGSEWYITWPLRMTKMEMP